MTTATADLPLDVFLVAHTHWDREWYHPAERFRQRLVALVDELLEHPPGQPFLLDGQAVVLEDYLEIRPERASELSQRLRDGELEAGPWFVLADELIPSGEGLVRNLLAGRRVLQRLRAVPPSVLYCPDSFGHPAVLPALAAGFGCAVVIVWRGYGGARWPAGDTVRWRAPDGTVTLLYHLPPDGYEAGSHLPVEPDQARERWRLLRAILRPRATLGMALLPHGADHHAPQVGAEAAIEALAQVMREDRLHRAPLDAFAAALVDRAAGTPLPQVQGELRDSYGYAWTLQETFGVRAALKRRYAMAERLLLHDVEPWLALARLRIGQGHRALLQRAWRTLLLCQPHDTLCGCSIDAVADAMASRLDDVTAAATGLRSDAIDLLVGHDAAGARARVDAWRPVVIVRNPVARVRSGLAELTVDRVVAEVAVGPGSAGRAHAAVAADQPAWPIGARAIQEVASERVFVREESPRHYPRTRLVERHHLLAWVDDVPAVGARLLPLGVQGKARRLPQRARAVRGGVANDLLRVVARDGGLLLETVDGRTIRDWLGFEVEGERGDLYTHSRLPLSPPLDSSDGHRAAAAEPAGVAPIETSSSTADPIRARLLRTRVVARGPLRAALEVQWAIDVPALQLTTAAGDPVRWPAASIRLRTQIALDAGAPFVRVGIAGENGARNVRLRVRLRSDVSAPRVFADAAFGPVERVPIRVSPEEAAVESPPATAPLHRYVSLYDATRGCTVVSDGLAEYEAAPDGSVAITLLRATGELSRPDLAERPGHAGYPAPTPGAQSLGPFEANLALLPHGPRSPQVIDEVERAAEDALLPLVGHTWRTAVDPPHELSGAALRGAGLTRTTIKESEDGAWIVLRCVNLLDHAVEGAWRVPGVREARLARLDETPLGALTVQDGEIAFDAGPRAILTILAR
ncbi:MAG TPA: glycoside hydrolase family 38 C-terminal domain-containing protein [Gemmatimonadaceae bacterium]